MVPCGQKVVKDSPDMQQGLMTMMQQVPPDLGRYSQPGLEALAALPNVAGTSEANQAWRWTVHDSAYNLCKFACSCSH